MMVPYKERISVHTLVISKQEDCPGFCADNEELSSALDSFFGLTGGPTCVGHSNLKSLIGSLSELWASEGQGHTES